MRTNWVYIGTRFIFRSPSLPHCFVNLALNNISIIIHSQYWRYSTNSLPKHECHHQFAKGWIFERITHVVHCFQRCLDPNRAILSCTKQNNFSLPYWGWNVLLIWKQCNACVICFWICPFAILIGRGKWFFQSVSWLGQNISSCSSAVNAK